jgi:hypothetical protein
MAKYIFATKFKKIGKEPLYYNIQVSVDKDCLASVFCMLPPFDEDIYFTPNEPIILQFRDGNYWDYSYLQIMGSYHFGPYQTSLCFEGAPKIIICEGPYPLPTTLHVTTDSGVTFTFTPIPVYEIKPEPEPEPEPLYYNMQLSVDKDCSTSELGFPLFAGGKDFNFYKDSPIILSFISENRWAMDGNRLEIEKNTAYTSFYLDSLCLISICEGHYPLPETISIIENDVTFTFTPIPVYE